MPTLLRTFAAACLALGISAGISLGQAADLKSDPRLREVAYDPQGVVTVPVKRGIVTLLVLEPDEAITEVASGLGADCSKPEASWCIAAQPGGRNVFVKPKSAAGAPNNLAVVTNKHAHAFRFVVLADGDARQPVYRLAVKAPLLAHAHASGPQPGEPLELLAPAVNPALNPSSSRPTELASTESTGMAADLVAERLAAAPQVVNSKYSIAEGQDSQDILPSLVFDDGRFTYLRFANNREVPAVFHVLGDGSETLVNARMEGDLLVVDRVSRRLMLRAGSAVVSLWNDAFDLGGVPPAGGTTVQGVRRVLKASAQAETETATTVPKDAR